MNTIFAMSNTQIKSKLKDPSLLRSTAYINGQWLASEHDFDITDPGSGQVIAKVANLDQDATRLAVDAAASAFPSWRKVTARARDTLLRSWYELIQANKEDLATLITAEGGKTYAESLGEVAYAASFVEWFSEQARRVNGEILPSNTPDKRLLVTREPVGVCAAITPWNFPAAMITRKVAPALAVGCTVVVKPAEQTPLTALALAVLAERAGIPPGVFNVVTGDAAAAPAIGAALTGDSRVRKLSFTGSTQVGRLLMAQSAPNLKRLSLELGGNAPFIVFADADLDAAVDGAIASKYRNSGQTCVCANRFLVHQDVMDVFADKLTAKVRSLQVGHGFEAGAQIGPLIDAGGLAKVSELVADAVSQGATVLIGGAPDTRGGLYYQPTVIKGVAPQMRMMHEEIFGPVAPLFTFSSDDEAIQLANATEFGLAAYFYTRDSGRIFRVSEALEYGMVGVNTGLMSSEVAPFGGVKQSGFGREGSQQGVDEYLSTKYTCLAIE
jgi:succinate-semialdehyde dehydrogenase/glutarate-semialdehyde dehydrogenase